MQLHTAKTLKAKKKMKRTNEWKKNERTTAKLAVKLAASPLARKNVVAKVREPEGHWIVWSFVWKERECVYVSNGIATAVVLRLDRESHSRYRYEADGVLLLLLLLFSSPSLKQIMKFTTEFSLLFRSCCCCCCRFGSHNKAYIVCALPAVVYCYYNYNVHATSILHTRHSFGMFGCFARSRSLRSINFAFN